MVCKEYLSHLSRQLRWWCDPDDLAEILEDYREHFAAGMAEGKSEEALCAEFGDPRDIARTLRREHGAAGKSWLRPLALALAAVWFAACFFSSEPGVRIPLRFAFLTLTPLLVNWALGGARRHPVSGKRPLTILTLLFCLYGVGVTAAIGALFAHNRGNGLLARQQAGWAMQVLLSSAAVAAVAACILALYLWHGNRRVYPAVCLAAGFLAALEEWGKMSRYYPEDFPAYYIFGLEQIVFGVLLIPVFAALLRLCTGKPRARLTNPADSFVKRAIQYAALILVGFWAFSLTVWNRGGRILFVLAAAAVIHLILWERARPQNALSPAEGRVLFSLEAVASLCGLAVIAILLGCLRGALPLLVTLTEILGPSCDMLLNLGSAAVLAAAAARIYRLPFGGLSALCMDAAMLAALRALSWLLSRMDDAPSLLWLLRWSLLPVAVGVLVTAVSLWRDGRKRKWMAR